ncbi:hypothetical protein D3C76_1515290 [compost metagenome]
MLWHYLLHLAGTMRGAQFVAKRADGHQWLLPEGIHLSFLHDGPNELGGCVSLGIPETLLIGRKRPEAVRHICIALTFVFGPRRKTPALWSRNK